MNTPINDGGPAFPIPFDPQGDIDPPMGMSLRDWFAGKAIPSIIHAECRNAQAELENKLGSCSNGKGGGCRLPEYFDDHDAHEFIAKASYAIADAMLLARLKQPKALRAGE